MNDPEPRSPHEDSLARPDASTTSGPSPAAGSATTGDAPPPPPESSPERSTPVTMAKPTRRTRVWPLLSNRKFGRILAAAVMAPVIGLSVGLATTPSASAAQSVSAPASGGGGSNARSGPAAGGASGTVASVAKSSFTMTTSAGQKVTVDETSSTKYLRGASSTSAGAIKRGTSVLVLGTTNGTTVKATQVVVQTTATAGTATSSASKVIAFQRGAPTTSKTVGQIPASYSQGSGTIVSGTTANKATEAALAAYPGGIVDRVVKLSNGEYEVHYIGVNWPHHVFVNQDFKVVGAD
jgi:hypothetical protein